MPLGIIESESKEQRLRHARDLAAELAKIDGVVEASTDDWTSTADTISIVIELEANRAGAIRGWAIDANLRSVAQRIRSVVDDFRPDLRGWDWARKPQEIREYDSFSGKNEFVGHKFPNYIIDTYWR